MSESATFHTIPVLSTDTTNTMQSIRPLSSYQIPKYSITSTSLATPLSQLTTNIHFIPLLQL
ncbi:445_t:CDS:2 [Diversispora eburnea]|uniref:445_t:CDS:1 n=1 Tax=Diversispora eburnea TaxID=1213867 RepID=A0A9N8WQJ6_9GLOM|nr:445_t:CDS:2 [Diversispora eburnea]